jgi:AcrR family transcriptional regulator
MSISYLDTGRTRQKARTRDALVDAARELMGRGVTPTVEDAAAEANVSRATAYRYFRNQRELLVAARPELEYRSLLGDDPPESVEARLEAVVERIVALTLEQEHALRALLRLSLESDVARTDLEMRKGRRLVWVRDALAPLEGRIEAGESERLALAIAAAVGVESLVWLTDVARLPRDGAAETMRWSAHTLLRGALAGSAPAR